MDVIDLGVMSYRPAWEKQQQAHDEVAAGAPEKLLLVEHPPVITLGRRPDSKKNLLASEEKLRSLGIELVQSDRGGDITYHGPGQLVAYPIVRLLDHRLSVSAYMHRLEAIVISILAAFGLRAEADPSAVGIWTEDHGTLAKIGALGVRIRRGVSMHGLALNVMTDLSGFSHIIPCGLESRPVTSMARLLGSSTPSMDRVKQILTSHFIAEFSPGRLAAHQR